MLALARQRRLRARRERRASRAVAAEAVALVNTDVVLAPDWLERAAAALDGAPEAASVATKLVDLERPGAALRRRRRAAARRRVRAARPLRARRRALRRAGRGLLRLRGGRALPARGGRWPSAASTSASGRTSRTSTSACGCGSPGWTCRWEPRAVARHAGGGSSAALPHGPGAWVERNTLLLVARAFPPRWLPLVAYRQARAGPGTRRAPAGSAATSPGARMALPLLPAFAARAPGAARRGGRARSTTAVPARPIRGPRAGGAPVAARALRPRRRAMSGQRVRPSASGRSLWCAGMPVRPPPPRRARSRAGAARSARRRARPERRRRPVPGPVRAARSQRAAAGRPATTPVDSDDGEPEPAAPPTPAPEPAPAPRPAGSPLPPRVSRAAAASRELPRTGADDGRVLLAGAILLAGGVALRVRLRERS